MDRLPRAVPVPHDDCCIWIIRTENTIWNACFPNITLIMFPIFHLFRACDHSGKRYFRTIYNAGIFPASAVFRVYIFAVNTRRNNDFVTCAGDFSSGGNCLKRFFARTISASSGTGRHIVNHFDSSQGYIPCGWTIHRSCKSILIMIHYTVTEGVKKQRFCTEITTSCQNIILLFSFPVLHETVKRQQQNFRYSKKVAIAIYTKNRL